MRTESGKRLGIYIHIPFCRSKCAYCDFYSFVPRGEKVFERYTEALINHMHCYKDSAADSIVDTVFIGGGTPTVLPPEYLLKIIRAVKKTFHVSKNAEFSIEVNPATVDKRTFVKLRRCGINRVSIGLQSAISQELRALSRTHTRDEFEKCFYDARSAKINNINVDVMFGIPLQTRESLMHTLEFVSNLSPEHISLYDLKVEPHTKFGSMGDALILPDEDTEFDMYRESISYLRSRGYNQYEISNFAKNGFECKHNLKYWNCDEYLGFGPAAHSFYNKSRYSFVRSIEKYMCGIEDISGDVNFLERLEEITGKAGMGEYIMLRLRLCEGINYRDFYRRFGADFESLYGSKLEFYLNRGYMKKTDWGVAFTTAGMFVSNYILSDILSFEDLNAVSPNAQLH